MADILIAAGSTMQPAPAGQVTLFIDTENNNILSYIDSAGVIKIYNSGDTSELEECCSCVIAKQWIDRVTCSLKDGKLDATEFGLIMNQGLSVVSTETTDPLTGTKTCRVDIGPKSNVPVISVTIDDKDNSLAIGATKQLSASVLPSGADQNIIWISANPSKAVVSSTGLVLGIAAGTVVIFAYSAVDSSKFDTSIFTVS